VNEHGLKAIRKAKGRNLHYCLVQGRWTIGKYWPKTGTLLMADNRRLTCPTLLEAVAKAVELMDNAEVVRTTPNPHASSKKRKPK